MLGHLRWVDQWLNDVLEENVPFSLHWTAGKTFPKLPGKRAAAYNVGKKKKDLPEDKAVCDNFSCVHCMSFLMHLYIKI